MFSCSYSGYRHKEAPLVWILVKTFPDYFSFPSLLNAQEWSFLQPAKSTRERCCCSLSSVIHCLCLFHIHSTAYLRNVDSSEFLHSGRQSCHDIQHLSRKFGCSHVSIATGHHSDLVGCTQWLANLLCHLQATVNTEINRGKTC